MCRISDSRSLFFLVISFSFLFHLFDTIPGDTDDGNDSDFLHCKKEAQLTTF